MVLALFKTRVFLLVDRACANVLFCHLRVSALLTVVDVEIWPVTSNPVTGKGSSFTSLWGHSKNTSLGK